MRAMEALCRELLLDRDYARVRDQYCTLSIELNMAGKIAPAFRPIMKPGAEYGDGIYHQVNRDQLVIDLHWCHAKKMVLSPNDPMYQGLFSHPAEFPFDLAYSLACERHKPGYRATEALCLTTMQQCQMLKLRGPALLERQAALHKGWRATGGTSVSKIATAKRQLAQWVERDKRMAQYRKSYETLWLASELLDPGAKPAQIAALSALMMGEDVLDRRTIGDKLKTLKKNVSMS
jgi:hypothetical protein